MRTVGVLGGMGPMATVDLLQKIISRTQADKDQDHHHVIVNSNPKIPSRIAAILNGGESPLPALIQSAKVLEQAGADFIIIPCHTAHFWYEQIQKEVNIPIFHIIEGAVTSILSRKKAPKSILLLATSGTIKANLFQKFFQDKEISLKVPNRKEQAVISSAINDVKAGLISQNRQLEKLNMIIKDHADNGVDAVLAGCTEIPLLYPFLDDSCEKIDTTDLLAELVIRKVNGETC